MVANSFSDESDELEAEKFPEQNVDMASPVRENSSYYSEEK